LNSQSLAVVIKALNEHKIKYLIAGGLAVAAHGFLRFTADLDIILEMSQENLKSALTTFKLLGFKPRAPVNIESFSDPKKREEWVTEKHITVFSLWSGKFPTLEIDIFVNDPVGFDAAYKRAAYFEFQKGLKASFLSLDDLIKTKKIAGRYKDMDDIENLLIINKKKTSND
jgi:hypothetical protein